MIIFMIYDYLLVNRVQEHQATKRSETKLWTYLPVVKAVCASQICVE